MKRIFLTYGFLAVFSAGFAGLAAAHALPALPRPAPSILPAFLDGLFGDKKPQEQKRPEHPIHNDELFEQNTKLHTLMPYSRVELAFSMRVPKDWTVDDSSEGKNYEISQKILGNLAEFTSPMIGTHQPMIYVQAQTLEHEISARNWLRHYILSSNYAPDGDVTESNLRQASGYYIYLNNGKSYYVYITAHINGNSVVLAKFEVPLQMKEYTKYLQKKTIDSFSLSYPNDNPIEEQKPFTLVDSIKFSYPQSWEIVNPDFRDMNRLTVQMQNKSPSGVVQGFARIVAVRRNRSTDLKTEIENMKKYFDEEMQLDFTKMLSSGKSGAYDRFIFNRLEKYEVAHKKRANAAQNIHLAVLGDKEWYILMFLITPREDESLYNWARNTQSFDVILKSIK